MPGRRTTRDRVDVEPDAVIGDAHEQALIALLEHDLHNGRPGVLACISQGFLNDAKRSRTRHQRSTAVHSDVVERTHFPLGASATPAAAVRSALMVFSVSTPSSSVEKGRPPRHPFG